MSVFIFIIIIVGLVTFGEVASKWLGGGASRPTLDPGQDEEVARLKEQVALLANQVDRLSEDQRLMTRLLEARIAGPGPQSGESRSASHSDPATEEPI